MRLDYPPWNKATPFIRLLKQLPDGVLVDFEVDHAGEHRREPRVICMSSVNVDWVQVRRANDDEPGQLQGP